MVIEINEMIDKLEEFFNNISENNLVVGGVAGTAIEKMVVESALRKNNFTRILLLECCQDYLGLTNKSIPNHKYFWDLFYDIIIESAFENDPFKPRVLNHPIERDIVVNEEELQSYDVIIISNAHVLGSMGIMYIDKLRNVFGNKIVVIFDPIETRVPGSSIISEFAHDDIPVIIDSHEKLSPIIAYARATVGINTRNVNRKIPGNVIEVPKINKRSIGKIDDRQYVTNDFTLIKEITDKQRATPFRKNQKFLVNRQHSHNGRLHYVIKDGIRVATIFENSLLVMYNPQEKPYMTLRLYNSKQLCHFDITYETGFLAPQGALRVSPANIISVYDFNKHRYNHTVFISEPDTQITPALKYTILKNSKNVTFVNKCK